MRILILGEGPTDLGRFDSRDGVLEWPGVMPILVRRMLGGIDPQLAVDIRVCRWSNVKFFKKPSQKFKASNTGLESKLTNIPALQVGQWAEAIVAVVDRDKEKFHSRIDELNAGRAFLLQEGKKCAVGMAIEELEAWLLADEKALRVALEDTSIQLQKAPESLSSSDDRSENSPKGKLAKLIEDAGNSDSTEELFAKIAEHMDLTQLEQRCPKSFPPFADQVRQLLH